MRTRSTNKEVDALIKEVKNELGLKNKPLAWKQVNKASEFFKRKLKKQGFDVSLSPFRHGLWTLSGFVPSDISGVARWVSISTSFEEWQDTPNELIKRFIDAAKK